MNTFYIARHGETENNQHGRVSGWIDTPLIDTALVATQAAIAKLRNVPFQVLYSSDLGRAFVTAYVIARQLHFTDEIIRMPGLREVNYGEAANMKRPEAYKRYVGIDSVTDYTPPGGESLRHMQARVLTTMSDINHKHAHATILIVAHSGVMAALNSSFLGQDFGGHNISEAYPHDYVARFTVDDGKITSFEAVTA